MGRCRGSWVGNLSAFKRADSELIPVAHPSLHHGPFPGGERRSGFPLFCLASRLLLEGTASALPHCWLCIPRQRTVATAPPAAARTTFLCTAFWSAFWCVGVSRWAEHPFREVCRSCARGNERDLRWGRCGRSSPNLPQQSVTHTRTNIASATLPCLRNVTTLDSASLSVTHGCLDRHWGSNMAIIYLFGALLE